MALNEIEAAQVEKTMKLFLAERRPPPQIRHEVDIAYRVAGQSVEIFEVRPKWRGRPGETVEHGIAKATYVKARGSWRIYYLRQDLEWHPYEPVPEVPSIDAFCEVVSQDEHGCFFG